MTMKKIKTAVVGCGAISDIYLQNMTRMFSILEVASCHDIRPEASQKASEKYGIAVMTMEEIIADTSIELVVNLTAPNAHYPVISRLLKAKKHVYTEKPLATSMENACDLVRLAEENDLYLGSAPDTFLGAAFQTARWALDSGLLGEVTSCVATLNRDGGLMAERFPYTAKEGGGIATDVGIYYVTVLISLLGPVSEACGFSDTLQKERRHKWFPSKKEFGSTYLIESENIMAGSLRFKSGVMGSLHFNANTIQNEVPYIALYGTQGILYLPDPNHFGGQIRFQAKGTKETIALNATHGYAENSRGLGCAEMAWSILKKRTPRADKAMALHGLEIILGIMKSSATNKFYTMTSSFERPEPLPRGYLGYNYSCSEEESALA